MKRLLYCMLFLLFYLNPWIGGHLRIGGDTKVDVGIRQFHPSLVTPEVSLKLGWHF